jgi:hypothetical protein
MVSVARLRVEIYLCNRRNVNSRAAAPGITAAQMKVSGSRIDERGFINTGLCVLTRCRFPVRKRDGQPVFWLVPAKSRVCIVQIPIGNELVRRVVYGNVQARARVGDDVILDNEALLQECLLARFLDRDPGS